MRIKSKKLVYIWGIIITLVIYVLSMLVGSINNLLMSSSSRISIVLMIIWLITGIVTHVAFAWMTADILIELCNKYDCRNQWFFRGPAIAVVGFATTLIPVLFNSKSGWMTYTVHALALDKFGTRMLDKPHYVGRSTDTDDATNGLPMVTQDAAIADSESLVLASENTEDSYVNLPMQSQSDDTIGLMLKKEEDVCPEYNVIVLDENPKSAIKEETGTIKEVVASKGSASSARIKMQTGSQGKLVVKTKASSPQFCRFCGSELIPGGEFCHKCGKRVWKE